MSQPPSLELFIGGRSVLAYNPARDNNVANARVFGHGQTLSTLTVNRNYTFTYTIGSRRITAMPYGKFSVSWGTDFKLSGPEALCMVFDCSEDNLQAGTYAVRDCPRPIDLYAWLKGCPTANANLVVQEAVVGRIEITADVDRGPVEVSYDGFARDISLGTAPSPPSTLPLPRTIYTFAGAKLYGEGVEIPATNATISINQRAEALYTIGNDRYALPYHSELEVTARLTLPSSTYTLYRLQKLLEDKGIEGVRLELSEYNMDTSSLTGRRLVIELVSPNRISSFSSPLTDIGINNITIELRFSDIKLRIEGGGQ